MFTALKTVTREVAPSMGSNISRQRSARNQLDSTPANMLSITHSQRHPFRLSRNSCQLTSRKQNHSSTAASTSDKVYFNMFLKLFFINRRQNYKFLGFDYNASQRNVIFAP